MVQRFSLQPSLAEAEMHAASAKLLPVFLQLPLETITPVGAFLRLKERFRESFLLESAEGGELVGRYSFIGIHPFATLKVEGNRLQFTHDGHLSEREVENPLQAVGELIEKFRAAKVPGSPPFPGGIVGYVSYEAVRFLERIAMPERVLDSRDIHLMFFRRVVVFDQLKHRLFIISHIDLDEHPLAAGYKIVSEEIDEIVRMLFNKDHTASDLYLADNYEGRVVYGQASSGEELFKHALTKVKQYIRAGDIFQGVLSDAFKIEFSRDPFLIYRFLRMINPSPYLYFLDFGEEHLLGSSPEMLVRCQDRVIETCPIAGTRPRGSSEVEDEKYEKNLLASVKERAEHLMLVDLGRNDIGRVSELGSVRVKDFMKVERYSHVMHLVSHVTGRLAKKCSAWDAFCACFPAGTLTGAPKIRAMEIISELEPQRRGPYGGAVVYHDFAGNLNSCITIRSLFMKERRAYIQAGAGIVADSQAKREYEEILNKAKAVHRAVQLAGSAEPL